MSKERENHEENYLANQNHYESCSAGGEPGRLARTWLDHDTADAWRHGRMYAALDPLLESDPGASWLTIGDGRYGKDAGYISGKGGVAMATDLDDSLLLEAREMGLIARCAKENAEALSFENDSFDYVFCKESYHHFPRPMLALYEMLRVASKGVVLIEPKDRFISYSPVRHFSAWVAGFLLTLVRKGIPRHNFEEFGNYVYSISRRELEKAALGMNYRYLAFKGINDHYIGGIEFEKASGEGRLLRNLKRRIMLRDLLTRLRITDYGLLAAILFKQPPSDAMQQRLAGAGYQLVRLPENPNPHGSLKDDKK